MFYNTASETGHELELARASAVSHEARILKLFQSMKGHAMSARQVHTFIGGRHPITSTRRAITDLTKSGFLKAIGSKRDPAFGRKVKTWTVV